MCRANCAIHIQWTMMLGFDIAQLVDYIACQCRQADFLTFEMWCEISQCLQWIKNALDREVSNANFYSMKELDYKSIALMKHLMSNFSRQGQAFSNPYTSNFLTSDACLLKCKICRLAGCEKDFWSLDSPIQELPELMPLRCKRKCFVGMMNSYRRSGCVLMKLRSRKLRCSAQFRITIYISFHSRLPGDYSVFLLRFAKGLFCV